MTRENNLNKLINWCKLNDLEFVSWNGGVSSKFYYKSKDDEKAKYTFCRNVKFTLINNLVINRTATNYPMMTVESKKEYLKDRLEMLNAEPLHEIVLEDNYMVSFIVTEGRFSGCNGEVSVLTLKNFTSNTLLIKYLNNKSIKWYIDNVCENRGYKIIEYPSSLSSKCRLLSPKGNEWTVVFNNFDANGYNCPLDTADEKMSYGEKMVKSILEVNNIEFEMQKTIKYKDERWQYFDFFLVYENLKYCIEYNGIQHYEEVPFFKGNTLESVYERDKRKYEYCVDNNIKYIEIPYNFDNTKKVFDKLSEYFKLTTIPDTQYIHSQGSLEYNDLEVINYFKSHTQKKTAETFGISVATLANICRRNNFKKQKKFGDIKVRAKNVATNEIIIFENMKKASIELGFDVRSVLSTKNPLKPRKNWVISKITA